AFDERMLISQLQKPLGLASRRPRLHGDTPVKTERLQQRPEVLWKVVLADRRKLVGDPRVLFGFVDPKMLVRIDADARQPPYGVVPVAPSPAVDRRTSRML